MENNYKWWLSQSFSLFSQSFLTIWNASIVHVGVLAETERERGGGGGEGRGEEGRKDWLVEGVVTLCIFSRSHYLLFTHHSLFYSSHLPPPPSHLPFPPSSLPFLPHSPLLLFRESFCTRMYPTPFPFPHFSFPLPFLFSVTFQFNPLVVSTNSSSLSLSLQVFRWL